MVAAGSHGRHRRSCSYSRLSIGAPHPHAAMLFADFLMSKEAQFVYQELGYDSARRAVAGPGAQVERLYLTNRPNFIRDYEDWAKLYQDTFVRRRM